jgi:hypothetical protein
LRGGGHVCHAFRSVFFFAVRLNFRNWLCERLRVWMMGWIVWCSRFRLLRSLLVICFGSAAWGNEPSSRQTCQTRQASRVKHVGCPPASKVEMHLCNEGPSRPARTQYSWSYVDNLLGHPFQSRLGSSCISPAGEGVRSRLRP